MIGRKQEIKTLREVLASDESEFVALYGRRRVGKTHLIRNVFEGRFAFQHTGLPNAGKTGQLEAFRASLSDGRLPGCPVLRSWPEAFRALARSFGPDTGEKQVVFLDELPWMDTPKSGFVGALEHFWNAWASARRDIVLVVCGSAASWIVRKIFHDHGGLHNRTTRTLYLRQFTLAETEAYLKTKMIRWPRQMIVETYMMFGGIPYYLSLLNPQESLAQNIDRLYFSKNSALGQEYRRLYASLFKSPEPYIRIVEVLGKNRQGMTRSEIAGSMNVSSNGALSKQLENLEYCDIIRRYVSKVGGKPKNNDAYFQLTDLFTLFHLTFSKKLTTEDYWQQHLNTPVTNIWQGLAFEHVCMVHINQIRHALGLDRIAVEYYSWRSSSAPKAQIDMVIERADRLINLCEIKYTQSEFVITADEDMKLRNRIAAFTRDTKTHCGILPTWITPYGLYRNEYSASVQYQAQLDDLFV